eukprot:g5633.t1
MVRSAGSGILNNDSDERDVACLWSAQDLTNAGEAGGVDDEDGSGLRPELTRGQLLRIASGMLGLMFGWATKTVLTTPLFRDVYGVDPADLGYVWVAGPLSGLVVQPVVGVISDHREGQGQRSFFLAAGTIIMAASLALLPAAGAVCRHLAGNSHQQHQQQGEEEEKAGTSLAVAALWALDLAMNASLVAIRAVVADCAPPRQQPEANTVILVSYGAGTLLGYGFGAVDAASWLGLPPGAFWKSCVEFWVAALVLLVASAIATREAYQLERPQGLPFLKRRGPSSYAAVVQDVSRERCRQHDRHGSSGGRGGNGGRAGSSASIGGGGPSGSSATLADSSSINAGATAHSCSGSGGNGGGEGGEGGGGGANGGDGIDERGKGEQGEFWYEPSPAAAMAQVTATGIDGRNGPVADLRPSGDEPVRIPGAGDGSTKGNADGAGVFGVSEACLEDGGTTAGLECAEGVQDLPPSPSSFKENVFDMALFYDVPGWLLPVCLLIFHAWVGWFAIIIFGSDWVGVNVFGGDPSASNDDERRKAYEDGVSWASVGLALQAIVVTAMGCGPVTRLVRCAGFRGAFLTGVVIQTTCLVCAAFLRPNTAGRVLSLGVFAILGVPLALVESLPYMMVGMFSPHDKHGQLLGKLNVWIVLAQLALTLCVHPIVKHSRDGDGAVLLAGAVAGAIGVVFVPFIRREEPAAAPSTPSSCKAICRTGDQSPPSPCRVLLEQTEE